MECIIENGFNAYFLINEYNEIQDLTYLERSCKSFYFFIPLIPSSSHWEESSNEEGSAEGES